MVNETSPRLLTQNVPESPKCSHIFGSVIEWELLDSAWEPALLDLFVPLLDPRVGTQGSVQLLKVIAWLEVLALEGMTAMVIDEVLVAMSRLVLIGESGIERRRSEHGVLLFGSQFLL